MKKRITEYRRKIDELLANPPENADWAEIIREHLIQVGFFQHERLIHLIVTVLFALLMFIALAVMIMAEYLPFLALVSMLLLLLIPYIFHYYLLENYVQAMYTQYDRMLENKKNKAGE